MQFYRFEGYITNEKWAEENEKRGNFQKNVSKIESKSKEFNTALRKKAFYFVRDAVYETISIGIMRCDDKSPDADLQDFMDAITLSVDATGIEEITFAVFSDMLRDSERHGYIREKSEVLELFGLDGIEGRFGRYLDYEESVLEMLPKKEIYQMTEHFLARDTLIPELDRIFQTKKKVKSKGHPVHYMVFSDDSKVRIGICRILTEALSTVGRINGLRFSRINVNAGESLNSAAYECLYHCNSGGVVLVNYRGIDEGENDHASGERVIVETLCEIMRKYQNKVLTVFCFPRECTRIRQLFYENLGCTSFIEIKEEFVSNERALCYLKRLAKDAGVRTDKKLEEQIEKNKGYLAPDLQKIFDSWYGEKLKRDIYPQYSEIATVKREIAEAKPKGSAYDELMDMVGLKEAKKVINQVLKYYKAQKLFKDKGMHGDRISMHMVFTGNPGTAKTTVARLFAEIMKSNDILSKGKLIEVGRADLVGRYVGWTAPLIQKKFKEAMGSVLFIDEVYSLVDDRDGSYGDEAINTIVQEMENHRKDIIVIFAGYPDKMEQFLRKNPGLRSRIAFHVPFDDYDTDELCDIAELISKKEGILLSEDAKIRIRNIFDNVSGEADFGNGRFVRNMIEHARMNQVARLIDIEYDDVRDSDIETVLAEDFDEPVLSGVKKTRIGFAVS